MNYDPNCTSCSKESYKTIPLSRVFDKLNALFAKNDLDGVGKTLDFWENEARSLNDRRGLLEILNEKIGYFRRTLEKEKALFAVNEAFELIEKELFNIPKIKVRGIASQNIEDIKASNRRDFRF